MAQWQDPEIGAVRELVAAPGGAADGAIDYPGLRAGMDAFGELAPLPDGCAVAAISLGGRAAERLVPSGADAGRVLLYLHGGGFALGSPASHRGLAAQLAAAARAVAYTPDYRLAPEHACPAAVDDAVAAYCDLLAQGVAPERIVLAGDSAGGGLALAAALVIRDAGLPLPAGLFLISPVASRAPCGPSRMEKDGQDPMIRAAGIAESFDAYLAGRADDALSSPLRGDFAGLPPMLIHVGSEEVLLSDAIAVAERAALAGVGARLEVWPEMIHVWHMFYPFLAKGRQAIAEAGQWIDARLH